MRGSRKQGRRAPKRVFQPALDGCLEDRVLLSTQGEQGHTSYKYLLSHPAAKNAFHANVPPFVTSNAPKF